MRSSSIFQNKYLILISVLFLYLLCEIFIAYSKTSAVFSYYGSRGSEVIQIQTKLKNWGYFTGVVDGVYGYKTYLAVRKFQSKNRLPVDGVCGPGTLAALGITKTTSASSYNRNVEILAHLIHGEARGEPYTGQVAVGAVVMNRVRDARFPKTIPSVIYQSGAFDAVEDGQINLPANYDSYKAARDAINGWDPSKGSVYYFNPNTATSKWIWSRTIVTAIGKHYFAK